MKLLDKVEMLDAMIQIIGEKISQKDAYSIIQKLYEDEVITKREATLMLSALEKNVLASSEKNENSLRAKILIAFVDNLRYE